MPIALPSSQEKHYLSGMDWVIHSLDHVSRKKLGCGNVFQILMELDGDFEKKHFEESWSNYLTGFPHLRGKLARDFNLAPYWKVSSKKEKGRSFDVPVRQASSFAEAFEILGNDLNASTSIDAFPLRVSAVYFKKRWLLGFIFDHRLFDARGAELFMQGFADFLSEKNRDKKLPEPRNPAYLDRWGEQFEAGKRINRLKRSESNRIQTISPDKDRVLSQALNLFEVKCFSVEETEAVYKRAQSQAGPFMLLPYSLAVAIRAMRGSLVKQDRNGSDFVIPVTRELRTSSDERAMVFFNHLSFLFFSVSLSETEDFKLLVKNLSEQLYVQVKDQVPEALWKASMLTRIVPRALLLNGFSGGSEKQDISFSFALLGESAFKEDRLMNQNILNMIHRPRIPPTPGIGIFFSQYKNCLNIVLSYLEGLLSNDEAKNLMDEISKL